jgi:hypothetical protein
MEYAQRSTARLMDEHQMITEQLLAAQRRRPRGGGSDENGAVGPRSAVRFDRAVSQDAVTSAREPVEVTSIGCVTPMSLACHQPAEVTSTGLMTSPDGSHSVGINSAPTRNDGMSLAVDQLMLSTQFSSE